MSDTLSTEHWESVHRDGGSPRRPHAGAAFPPKLNCSPQACRPPLTANCIPEGAQGRPRAALSMGGQRQLWQSHLSPAGAHRPCSWPLLWKSTALPRRPALDTPRPHCCRCTAPSWPARPSCSPHGSHPATWPSLAGSLSWVSTCSWLLAPGDVQTGPSPSTGRCSRLQVKLRQRGHPSLPTGDTGSLPSH